MWQFTDVAYNVEPKVNTMSLAAHRFADRPATLMFRFTLATSFQAMIRQLVSVKSATFFQKQAAERRR